jgi:hypothetical protein
MSNWWKQEQPVVIKQVTPTLGLKKKAEYLKKVKMQKFKKRKK